MGKFITLVKSSIIYRLFDEGVQAYLKGETKLVGMLPSRASRIMAIAVRLLTIALLALVMYLLFWTLIVFVVVASVVIVFEKLAPGLIGNVALETLKAMPEAVLTSSSSDESEDDSTSQNDAYINSAGQLTIDGAPTYCQPDRLY